MKGVASTFFVIALAAAPVELSAQSTGKFALGANLSTKGAVNSDARATTGVGLLWRVGHGHEGWGWKYGLNWYSTSLDRPLAGVSQRFGELNIKAFMGGYGYTHVMGRTKVSANLMSGLALTTFTAHDGFEQAYRAQNAVDSVEIESSSTWVLKPEVSAWYDLTRKIGLNASIGYMIARPTITLTSPIDHIHRRVNNDVLMVKVGAVYSIF